jgi:hypothetical protein
MGTTYANITLKGPKAQDILQELGNQGRSAFVSPTEDDLTTIYEMDSDEGDSSILTDLAEDLSGYFVDPEKLLKRHVRHRPVRSEHWVEVCAQGI